MKKLMLWTIMLLISMSLFAQQTMKTTTRTTGTNSLVRLRNAVINPSGTMQGVTDPASPYYGYVYSGHNSVYFDSMMERYFLDFVNAEDSNVYHPTILRSPFYALNNLDSDMTDIIDEVIFQPDTTAATSEFDDVAYNLGRFATFNDTLYWNAQDWVNGYFHKTGDPDLDCRKRCLALAHDLYYMASILDWGWEYFDLPLQKTHVIEQVAIVTDYAYKTYENRTHWCGTPSNPPDDYMDFPNTTCGNYGLLLLSSMAYAGIVLNDEDLTTLTYNIDGTTQSLLDDGIDYYVYAANYLFNEVDNQTENNLIDGIPWTNYEGLWGLNTHHELYTEGSGYYPYVMRIMSQLMLAEIGAGLANRFNDDTFKQMTRNHLHMYNPHYNPVSWNDAYRRAPIADPLISVFWNSSDTQQRADIRNFVSSADLFNTAAVGPCFYSYHSILYAYAQSNTYPANILASSDPVFYHESSYYESKEFSVIRPEILSRSDFEDNLSMWVWHKNKRFIG
ncbi:MAG: hypothetical protein K8S56_03945, partial [Candidatus Cloacimonetes bacterium]|nr:hypothetical protein [Candidatus Cloacimonadota bacterium]